MRCDQIYGLNDKALEIVKNSVTRIIPEIPDFLEWEGDTPDRCFTGMFNELYPLCTYIMEDGSILEEKVEAAPWASGPCFFLALWDKDKGDWVKESIWGDEILKRI